MRPHYFGVFCLTVFASVPLFADNPDPAPPVTACHASLKMQNVQLKCSEMGATPIEKCKPNECVSRVYEVVHASPYAKIDNPPCGPKNTPSEKKDGYSICSLLSVTVPVGGKITRYMVAAVDTTHGKAGEGYCGENATCGALPFSLFSGYQVIKSQDGTQHVQVLFKNWRDDKGRRANLTVWFTPSGK
jgi:hypothetical protein